MDFPWCPDGEVVKLLIVAYPSLSRSIFHCLEKCLERNDQALFPVIDEFMTILIILSHLFLFC